MNDPFTMLSDAELELLDQFLISRIDEDAETDGKNEGVLDISELDGLFTAIVTGPVTIPPSQWLPAVWGDFEPVWQTEEEFGAVFSLMVRHMNSIAVTLMEYPDDFEPLFYEREVSDRTYLIVDEWCEGYQRGTELVAEEWLKGGQEIAALVAPIYAFTESTQWRGHDLNDDEVEALQHAIAPNVLEIHAYWLARRGEFMPEAPTPVRREEPMVGRNDPCPCGSGRKYKKCCLH